LAFRTRASSICICGIVLPLIASSILSGSNIQQPISSGHYWNFLTNAVVMMS
jgi:hypothetical protein